MNIAVAGLGRMGMQIAKRLHNNHFNVFAWNRSDEPRKEFALFVSAPAKHDHGMRIGSKSFYSVEDAAKEITDKTRVFWLMLPHKIVDEFLNEQLGPHLRSGDIVIDGGNSFYKDSMRRAEELKAKGVIFYDVGVSGGVWGLEHGFALMAGGPKQQFSKIEPVLKTLSSGKNYGLVGANGAGHFTKMVHNGIEYGMMEAIAEGYGVLKASEFNLDLKKVT